jgi:adenine-specific DNA-methyltransferase
MSMQDKQIQNRKKLQSLLRELFQFNYADLDFGIYRILNEKRGEIERFIEHDLLDAVEQGLAHFQAAERKELEAQLAEKRAMLGETALDETGVVREAFRNLPIAQDYMKLHHQLERLDVAEETEARIFNDLWRFFSRYYDNGDFFTERRYSSRESKFCVPYSGEEVLLHWANRDQYYVKTSERFTDYRFTAGPYTIWFRLQRAEVSQDNVKEGTRYFVPREEEPLAYDPETRVLTIFFEYRPITDEEEAHYLGVYNAQQTKSSRRKTLDRSSLCVALEVDVLKGLDDPDLKAHLAAIPDGQDVSPLGRHLNRYTARNTMDYFVHKDLGRFLRRELDFFLKNEVLRIDDVIGDETGEMMQHVLTRLRVVRQIAERIIAFLAQIEDFQKRLFEKRKFVVQTDYCITLDRVPEEFYPEILANETQLEEWRRLYNVDAWEQDLFGQGEFDEAFLQNHSYVMVDTAFFDDDFKGRLLANFENLDEATDGVLIQGENLQALNLLQTKYAGRVKCIYIDPPYNTGSDDNFAYKDNYQHSTWLTMMQDRLGLAYILLTSDGVIFVSIDDREKSKLRELMDIVYSRGMFIASFVRKRRAPSAMSQDMVSQDHEYVLAYGGAGFTTFVGVEKDYSAYSNPDNDPRGDWVAGDLTVGMTKDQRPNQYYNLVDPKTGKVYPPDPNRVWAYFPETMQQKIEEGLIIFPEDTSQRPKLKRFKKDLKTSTNPISTWIDTKADDEQAEVVSLVAGLNTEGTRQIQALFEENVFSYAKPTSLVFALAEQVTSGDERVMDFFAGSGTTAHAVIDLNRQKGGSRRYILVEVGDYFDDVLKPRIQRVAFSANWKDGVPQDQDGMSHMFKYQRIESYEDALNNICIHPPEGEQRRLLYDEFDDYMLHYMLDFETRESSTLLAPEAFEKPFQYTLKIHRGHKSPKDTVVDLVETFHYLIGMHVRWLERYEHQSRPYIVSRGEVHTERGVEKVAVIWRDVEGLDLDQEADWANGELLTEPVDRIYVNGLSHIDRAQPLEITFRELLEGGRRVA